MYVYMYDCIYTCPCVCMYVYKNVPKHLMYIAVYQCTIGPKDSARVTSFLEFVWHGSSPLVFLIDGSRIAIRTSLISDLPFPLNPEIPLHPSPWIIHTPFARLVRRTNRTALMDGRTDGRTDERMDGKMGRRVDRRTDGRMDRGLKQRPVHIYRLNWLLLFIVHSTTDGLTIEPKLSFSRRPIAVYTSCILYICHAYIYAHHNEGVLGKCVCVFITRKKDGGYWAPVPAAISWTRDKGAGPDRR